MADGNGSPKAVESTEENPSPLENEARDEEIPAGDADPNSDPNLFRYVRGDLFTSENFKVEIRNLPKFIGFNDLKKFLSKHGLNPRKIKLFGRHTFAFVTFKNEDERVKAMKMVHGMQWKGQVLTVKLAKPKVDPKTSRFRRSNTMSRPSRVLYFAPWRKMNNQECVMGRLFASPSQTKYKLYDRDRTNFLPATVQTEYRNECEFLISMGVDGQDKTVGFRLGKYKGGSCAVVGPADTHHIFPSRQKMVSQFQEFIRATPYSVYSPETYEGHWKHLTVRTTRTKQAMAMAFFNPQKLEEKELDELKGSMKEYFTEGEGRDSGVTSLYFVREGRRTTPNLEGLPCELVAGSHSKSHHTPSSRSEL